MVFAHFSGQHIKIVTYIVLECFFFKGNKKCAAYYVGGENGNISRMFLSKTD